jgi:hypothetical protein
MFLPTKTEPEEINESSNFNTLSKKLSFKKQVKSSLRDDEFISIVNNIKGLPKNQEVAIIKTNGCSDTGSIYTYISDNYELNELYLSTWIINKQNIDRIINDIDSGKLQKVYFVVSVRLKQLKKSDYAYLIEQFAQRKEKCFYKVCNSHAKIFSLSTMCSNYFTVSGSGNWTANPRIENYIIFNDINVYQHTKQWIKEICDGKKK